jgi:hypothetical protein
MRATSRAAANIKAMVDVHAARFQFVDIHVAGGTGAQEDNVFELRALSDQLGRHIRMVVERDLIAVEHARQFIADEGFAVDLNGRIARANDFVPHRRQLVVAVDKDGFHGSLDLSGLWASIKADCKH